MTQAPRVLSEGHIEGFVTVSLDEFLNPMHAKAQEQPPPQAPPKASTLPKTLVALDNVLDFVPLGATASNIVDLGLKHVVFRNVDPETSEYKEYLKHLKEKKTTTCLVYSIPLLGTVVKIGATTLKLIQPAKAPLKLDTTSSKAALSTHPVLAMKQEAKASDDDTEKEKITI